MNRVRSVSALLLSGLLASACSPRYVHTDLTLGSPAPVPVQLSPSQIKIPVGIAALVLAEPQSGNANLYDEYYEVELRSQDTAILDIYPGPNDREFVLVGVHAGTTCVEVVIQREVQECISTTVSAPEQ